eukprot:sb/3475507/
MLQYNFYLLLFLPGYDFPPPTNIHCILKYEAIGLASLPVIFLESISLSPSLPDLSPSCSLFLSLFLSLCFSIPLSLSLYLSLSLSLYLYLSPSLYPSLYPPVPSCIPKTPSLRASYSLFCIPRDFV